MLFVAAHILTYIRKICHSHTTKVLSKSREARLHRTSLSISAGLELARVPRVPGFRRIFGQ